MQALREGRIVPITIQADLSQCVAVPRPCAGKEADNAGHSDSSSDGAG